MENPLEQRWCELWAELDGRGNPLLVFAGLRQFYSEPHRAYHNLQHIKECLDTLSLVRKDAASPHTISLALWFHDLVYDTHRSDNEEQSAALLQQTGEAQGIKSSVIVEASDLILATKHHTGSGHPDIPLIVDIDLKILGETPERFDEYERQIQKEYAWVPQDLFAQKRAEILQKFLDRASIFQTEYFQKLHEKQARKNITRSIERLRGTDG
jgi:predicted metal-dependent HD superfamily phosphohydrolase